MFWREEGWLRWKHKHKRCTSRNLGGKGALSNIRVLFDLRSLRAWGVCSCHGREERAAERNRVRGERGNTLVATLVQGTRALTLGDEMARGAGVGWRSKSGREVALSRSCVGGPEATPFFLKGFC